MQVPVNVSSLILLACSLGFSLASTAEAAKQGDRWPQWRGPSGNGVAPAGGYPLHWNAEAGTGIAWKVDLPSRAGSTPIVWDDQIFVTLAIDGKNALRSYGWDGKSRWEITLGAEDPGKHKKGSGCNPSPVTDGSHVFVYFKSGDLAAVSMTGQIVWQKNLQKEFGEDTLWWDLGTSPIVTDQHVIVACVQSGPSYLAAFDKQSGDVAWKVDRMLDAPEEANQTYSTPILAESDGRTMMIVVGADHVTAHDVTDGKELWRLGGFNPEGNKYFRSIASPVLVDRMIVAPYARGETLSGISLTGQLVWHEKQISSDVPTPAAHDGLAFICNDKGTVAAVEGTTGKVLWQVDTGKNRHAFSASPILAGNHLYVSREDAAVFVIDVQTHQLVATNEIPDEFLVSTPVFANGRILLRTSDRLICVGPAAP